MKSQSNSDFELTRRQRKEGYTTEKENLEESPLKKAIIAAMIGVGGIGAYKSGMLKKPISKLIEFAGDYQSLSPAVGTAFKSWAGEETKFQNSVLRKKFRHTISDAFTENKPIEKYVSSVLEDTEKDLKYLKKTTKKYVEKRMKKNMKGELSSLATTELSYNIGKMNEIAERFDNRSARKAKDIMTKDFLKNFTVSAEESAKKMKRTGYRTATIDDMFEVGRADNGKLYLMNKHDNFMFDIKTRKNLAIFLNETKAVDSNGKYILNKKNIPKSIFETGDYKNIMVDKNLVINEFGEVADMRQNIKDINSFLRDAANEFKIPFVGINPLKFFGVGRAGVREQMFETLHPNTVQPSVTGLTGRQKLKDLKEFGNKRLLFSNGTAYKFNSDLQDFEKVADGLTLREYNHRNNIDSKLNDFRKMSGIELRKYEEYTKEDGAFKYYKGKLSKFLDLGRQDSKSNKYEESLINSISPNNIIEKASDKLFSKLNFTKPNVDDIEIYSAFGEIGDDWERNEKLYVALKKHIRWKDVMDPLNNTTIKEYFAQFFKGRKDVSNITESTLATYHLFERMNQAFKPFGIALGSDSMGSTKDIISGLLLKRLLPVYMVGQGIEYMTYLSERDDGDGGTTNIKKGVANVVKDINLGVTKVKDATGITSLFKGLKDSMPGYESFSELPLIKNLGLDRTYEEQKEWYNSGMEAIRKGRYWDLGNTAFIGGKVTEYQPNWYRKIQGDADFSENKYGSRKEYFENTWYPNPVNPFAPIKHFITDKYHYEEKHYYDRPYLLTSPEFENVPLVGPVLSSTVGRVIKPQVKMHEEYWNSPKGTNSLKQDSYIMDYNTDERGNENVLNDSELITNNNIENVSTGNSNILNIKPKGSTLGVVGQNLSDDGKEIYVTNSGNIGFIDINRDNYTKIKRELKTKSPKSMLSINNAPNREPIYNLLGRNEDGELVNQNGDVIINPNELKNSLKDQYMDSTNVLGLYGFLANSFVTGNLGEDQDVIDTPSYAFSYNKEFWDANMGGLGGDISEIFRRFVQKRRTDVDYYNPVRNTQPDWMPGGNYFQDYKHGDPFSKISNGELRLAGTPYEKIWGIKDPLELRIGSSFLGKTKDEIVDHFLQNDTITDEGLVDIVETGTKMHEEIEQEWLKDGFALEVEGRIEDEENKILGFYDAKVVDPTAKTGVGIVDIKTISDKGFNQIVETGEAKDLHRRQVNYYLWATGNDKGYVHYVNRDDPNKRYTVGFNYDEDMLEDSLNNVKDARNEVLQRYYNNEISRGDLYKPIDRYRILADVAPWSQEFTEMQNVLRASGMDETTKREYDEINERVKVQKKAHNTYEYRYRYADVSSVNAKITKVKGNQFYTDYGGEERAIKFAGINLGVVGNAEEKKRIESISSNIKEGANVQLLVDEDSIRRDKSKSIKAVVIDSKGTNLNKEFLKQGVAEEDKDDWSAPSVHARYSKTQIAFGSIWERFAHMDTPFHTKFLQVRSATEDYKRREVYGVDFARWQEPIEDFLKPAVYSAIERPTGLLFGALLGSLFGKKKFGKYAGAIAGMGAVLVGKGVVRAKEAITGEKWIPEPVRKERELVEYMDVLKYVKNQNLYNHYKKRALDEEGFDVDEYEKNIQEEADKREHITNSLKKGKKFIKEDYEEANEKKKNYEENKKPTKHEKTGNEFLDKILNTKYEISKFLYDFRLNRLTEKAREKREDFREVNKKINGVESYRNIDMLPELATKALEYKEKAEKTMYGYDVGEPLTNILAALPKIDRDRINDFINAPEEEREELLEIAPDYVKRVLQSSWGLEVDEKPSLEEYFKRHQLPDESWEGWQEDVDLESIKVKMINKEGLDYSDFNVWDDDVERADMLEDIPLPTVNFRNNAINIKNRLNTLLNDIGIQDVKIDYTFSSSNANVDLNIQHSSRDQVEEKINNQKFL